LSRKQLVAGYFGITHRAAPTAQLERNTPQGPRFSSAESGRRGDPGPDVAQPEPVPTSTWTTGGGGAGSEAGRAVAGAKARRTDRGDHWPLATRVLCGNPPLERGPQGRPGTGLDGHGVVGGRRPRGGSAPPGGGSGDAGTGRVGGWLGPFPGRKFSFRASGAQGGGRRGEKQGSNQLRLSASGGPHTDSGLKQRRLPLGWV